MSKHIIRAAAVLALVAGSIVACGNDNEACAGNAPRPPAPKPYKPAQPYKPGGQRTTSKVQDKPRPAAPKPTNWGGYGQRVQKRTWTSPYKPGYPVAPRPIIVNHYGTDYRTYPGYTGYYPVGVWPVGYGAKYGCVAEQEGEAQR